MKKFILITIALSTLVFAKVGVDPYDPGTFRPSHPVDIDPYNLHR